MYLTISSYYSTFLAELATDRTVIQLQVYLAVCSCSHLEQKGQFPCNCLKKKEEKEKADDYSYI